MQLQILEYFFENQFLDIDLIMESRYYNKYNRYLEIKKINYASLKVNL